ncbi:MAG: bile acid:sodium symporter family protein [Saprospiraceae bacterium]
MKTSFSQSKTSAYLCPIKNLRYNNLGAIGLVDTAVSAVLALIMFGVGLSLTFADFERIFRRPKVYFTALISQMGGLPVIAFLIALIAPLSPGLKVGFMILASSPGGATSNFLTYLWRGNVALSLSLTATNSILTLFTIPVVVNFALRYFLGRETELHLPFWDTVQQIFIISLIPAFIGLMVRRYRPLLADAISRPARYVMLSMLGLVFLIKMFAGESQGGAGLDFRDFIEITPVALLQNAACLFFGYFIMQKMGLPHAARLTTAIECGVQNTTLAFLIAGNLLGSAVMVKPALIYSLYSFWTTCIFAWIANRMHKKRKIV